MELFWVLLLLPVYGTNCRVEGTLIRFYGDGNITADFVQASGSYLTYKTAIIEDNIVEVETKSFQQCDALESVFFANSVRILGSQSFKGLTKLKNIYFGTNLEIMRAQCWFGCKQLQKITIPKSCQKIESQVFEECRSLTDVIFEPGSVITEIGSRCFCRDQITQIDIPDSLEVYSGERVFLGILITSLHIGSKVRIIGSGLCAECLNLERITVSDANPSFQSINGVLYTKATNPVLIMYPVGSTLPYTIPSSGFNLASFSFSGMQGNEIIFESPSAITVIPVSCFYSGKGIQKVSLPSNLETIQTSAFAGCSGLNEINIPSTLTELQPAAFSSCFSLTMLTGIESNPNFFTDPTTKLVYTLDKCNLLFVPASLSTVSFPDELTSIPNSCFNEATQLKHVTLPRNCSSIGSYAFQNSGILAISFPPSMQSLNSYAFYLSPLEKITFEGCHITLFSISVFMFCNFLSKIIFETGTIIDYIGENGFTNCLALETVDLAFVTKQLKQYCFQNCGLISVTLASEMTIADSSFRKCTKLRFCSIPVTTITTNSFRQSGLETLTIEKTVRTIEESAFAGCDNLTKVTFEEPATIETLKSMSFANCISLESINLPKTIIGITASIFSHCIRMKSISVEFGSIYNAENGGLYSSDWKTFILCVAGAETMAVKDEVETLGMQSFFGCSRLKTVDLGPNIKDISGYCFYECDELEQLNIPINITHIGEAAINSPKLKKLFYCGTSDAKISVDPNAIGGNPTIFVSYHYTSKDFQGNKVVKSRSVRDDGCPNEPSKPFSNPLKKHSTLLISRAIMWKPMLLSFGTLSANEIL